jgi:hypothetical protein
VAIPERPCAGDAPQDCQEVERRTREAIEPCDDHHVARREHLEKLAELDPAADGTSHERAGLDDPGAGAPLNARCRSIRGHVRSLIAALTRAGKSWHRGVHDCFEAARKAANQNKGTCLKLYRNDGSAIYAHVAAGATAFTLTTTPCANVSNF